jgi:hypothetical protein
VPRREVAQEHCVSQCVLLAFDDVRAGDEEERLPLAHLHPASSIIAAAVPVLERGADEAAEQRMRGERLALELGVELAPDEVGVVGQLDHLHQVQLGL